MRDIVDIQLKRLLAKLDEQGIVLEIDDKAKDWLAQKGFDSIYGARPLRRVIQKGLENPIASKIISGFSSDRIKVTADDDTLKLS
ncbi:MAG: hypothetical protein LBL30_01870 [Holosporales bacterium]|nr:hypothetical protein [Holosporales bacterium]